jgi:MerR family copper efflux transcriptional regulator
VSKEPIVNMTELLAAAGDERVTPRFVRFLVAEGVIPSPRGGRANADYGDDHVGGIRRYLRLRDLGLSASRVKGIVAGSAAGEIPVPIAPGLTLMVDPGKLAAPPSSEAIAAGIAEAVGLIRKKDD